jgi:uncharacterized circularly permuted ATP-grasp superfamily protein/uncharacterized alpha-E superfamily protein
MSEPAAGAPALAGGPSPSRAGLLGAYLPPAGAYDEMMAGDGTVRPHWQWVLEAFAGLTGDARAHALEVASRMLRENGVTYVAQGDPERRNRPWQLDLIPLLVGQAEWLALEAALIQRAQLLNAVLADLYGDQRLLKEGVLPAALVYGNHQFLRPCHGIPVPGDVHLHLIAFDLGRAADGSWWVLSDRTEAPSGAGYALENRIVASRALPELFAEGNVQRLASFFGAFSEQFLALSRHDEPLAVVLSPGPSKEVYFEHAYLARYLGYTVVEGSDLTVRDDRLYLKTVEGLKPVDLLLRRIPSEMCDPLELNSDSTLGVPGLLQSARAGNVAIANALGSGLVETDALIGFLPGLCRFLMQEDLKLPSIATWWCGQPQERDRVLANLDRVVIRKVASPKTIFAPGRDSYIGPELAAEERDALARQIARHGHAFIGQEMVALSTTPTWRDGDGLKPAPMTLRIYLAAGKDGYRMMPGGLARVALKAPARAPWLGPGDLSKDSWVLWRGPVDTFSVLTQPHHAPRLKRSGRDLPSRSADNLFWLGRYAERSEGAVRLLRSLVVRLGGEAVSRADPVMLERLASLLVIHEHLSPRRARRAVGQGVRAVEHELSNILFDPDTPDGLVRVLGNVRRVAELVRERLSLDTWQILKELTEITGTWRPGRGQELDDARRLLNRMIQLHAALNGMVLENMTRGYGWRFLDMGRRLERARHGARLVRQLATRDDPEPTGMLDLLLELADSTMTYRTRYQASPLLPGALDLLLTDETSPRAVLFQLIALDRHLDVLPLEGRREGAGLSPAKRLTTGLTAELRLADMARMCELRNQKGVRVNLERLVRRLDAGVEELSDVIARTYFSHSMTRHVSGPHTRESVP